MRHAWLIIAHNEFGILQRLVSELDSVDDEIFIHFDRKVRNLPKIVATHSKVHVLGERVDVRWGSVSQIKTELTLLEAASEAGRFDYYHIISGTTLPLKPLDEIHAFFDGQCGKSVFTGLGKDLPYQETLKVRRYNLFLKHYSDKGFGGRASQFLWKASIAIQRILGIEKNRDREFFKASNWLSLTGEAAELILLERQEILKTYRHSFCGDEYFIPSELMTSPLKEKVINHDRYLKCDIPRATSGVFSLSDLDALRSTGFLFARKFSSK